MLHGYRVFDADAHGSISPKMWQDLPEPYRARRPRPVTVHDESGLGNYHAGWLIEGSLEPHALGPGAQQANTPRNVLAEFGADTKREHCSVGSMTLADPAARLRDLDRMGFDAQMLFPRILRLRSQAPARRHADSAAGPGPSRRRIEICARETRPGRHLLAAE